LIVALIVFFSAFNILEANLPSLVSRAAPARAKGTALGVYSSLQFLGIFAGGALGGLVNQSGGATGVFAFTMTLALIWLLAAAAVRRRAA
jgi:predicted MFS family arabinose efflux permease